jgi:hypothetical protein
MDNAQERLESRIKRLEKLNTIYILVIVFFCSIIFLGLQSVNNSVSEVVKARQFELVSSEGNIIARLTFKDNGPGLYLIDEDGRDRVAMIFSPEQGGYFVLDESGNTRLGAALFAHGGAGYALHGKDMKGTAVLYYKEKGTLSFYGPEGEVLLRLPVDNSKN